MKGCGTLQIIQYNKRAIEVLETVRDRRHWLFENEDEVKATLTYAINLIRGRPCDPIVYPDIVACKTFFIGPHDQINIWTWLRERYPEKTIQEAAEKSTCGCAHCVWLILKSDKKS